jgi:hypothetical protein
MYNRLGIQHESDSGYGKGWDIIKTEYLSTMKRFFNLDYENLVVVSHEITKDITKGNGQTLTAISPNIQESIANKIAGMVDVVARVKVEGDSRTLNFKSSNTVFGGGRLKGIKTTSIPLSWEALMGVYDEVNAGKAKPEAAPMGITPAPTTEVPSSTHILVTGDPIEVINPVEVIEEEPAVTSTPGRRGRKPRKTAE